MVEYGGFFRKFNFVLLVCVFILMLPYCYYLFGNYYSPSTDEAYQLQAAIRMANGEGCTSTHLPNYLVKEGETDLKYRRMISWPIGYSFVMSRLMIVGLDSDLAAKLFKMLVIMSGIFLWIKIASRLMESRLSVAMFAFLLCPIVTYVSRATTELILWALFPLLSMLMFDLYFLRRKENHQSCEFKIVWRVLVSGMIVSLMVLTKYSGMPSTMIGIAWIIALNIKKYKDTVIQSLLFAILPTIAMVTLFYSNRMYTGHHVLINLNNIPKLNMGIIHVPEMLLFTLFPQKLLNFVADSVGMSAYALSAISIILGWLFIGWFFYICRKIHVYRENKHLEGDFLIKWTMLSFICLCAFIVTNMVMCVNGMIPESRFFLIIMPFTSMIIVQHIFLKYHQSVKNAIIYILTVFFLICLSANYSFAKYLSISVGSRIAEKHDVVNMAKSIMENHNNSPVVVFANDSAYSYLFQSLSVPTYVWENTKSILDATSNISNPRLVFVVSDVREDGPNKNVEILTGHHFHSIKIGLAYLYWKQFEPKIK